MTAATLERTVRTSPDSVFRKNVFVKFPDGRTSQKSPSICATPSAAEAISSVLAEAGSPNSVLYDGFADSPYKPLFTTNDKGEEVLNTMGGGIAQVDEDGDPTGVPYLLFPVQPKAEDGKFPGPVINAGILLSYFNHGVPSEEGEGPDVNAETNAALAANVFLKNAKKEIAWETYNQGFTDIAPE